MTACGKLQVQGKQNKEGRWKNGIKKQGKTPKNASLFAVENECSEG